MPRQVEHGPAWRTGALLFVVLFATAALAQDAADEAGPLAESAAADDARDDLPGSDGGGAAVVSQPRLNVFTLLLKGRWMMLPIGAMSILVVTFGIERAIALRRFRVMPTELVEELGQLADAAGGFDPRKAYRCCQKYPSAAATVVRSMLLKIGRPHSEVEHAVQEVSEREAERLFANVRWLNLAAVVTPLMGLLGTVWGMIQAFFDTTQMPPGQNKADFLAEGIYVALVTTLGGLAVAIPAAILAHYFEGRILILFHQIDEMLFGIMPQIERFEGRLRVSHSQLGDNAADKPAAKDDVVGEKRKKKKSTATSAGTPK